MPITDYLSPEAMAEANVTWDELAAIREDFALKAGDYEQAAQAITNVLLKTPGVHSGRYRVKDFGHLVEKVARKRHTDRSRVITVDNYEQEITDLAGVRVLHLFKSDWQSIHQYITDRWEQHEPPTAYYRKGDSDEVLEMFREQKCNVKEHLAGYRSVHYIIETALTKTKRLVEIQVRTIFEEGWSEVDHKLRYPNFSDDPRVASLLLVLNRLAGNADELSSSVQELNEHLTTSRDEVVRLRREYEAKLEEMQRIIDESNLSGPDKSKLQGAAKSLEDQVLSINLTKPTEIWTDILDKYIKNLSNPSNSRVRINQMYNLNSTDNSGEQASQEEK